MADANETVANEPASAPPLPRTKAGKEEVAVAAGAATPSEPAPQTLAKPPSPEDQMMSQPLDLPDEDHTPPAAKPPRAPKPKKHLKKPMLILAGLLLLAALGYGGLKLIKHRSAKPTPVANSNTSKQTSTSQVSSATTDVPDVTDTKDFKNDSLGLELTYPSSWTATNTSDIGVRITSPEFKYETTNKGIVTGNFRLYIRSGARAQDSKYIGRGVAILASQPLKYDHPTTTQRTQTNLQLFGLDTTDNFAFMLVAGNFNLKTGDSLGPNYGKEAGTIIVAGGYSSKDLTDDLATNMVPTSSYAKPKAYNQAIDIIKSLKLQ